MKYNYEEHIEKLGGKVVKEFDKHLLCSYLGLNFRVYKVKLRENKFKFEGNFRACESASEYFKLYMAEFCKHKNLDFSNSVFIGMREHVTVGCKEHGLFATTPELLVNRNSGCVKCYNKYHKHLVKNKGKEKFVEEASNRFDNKFDYTDTMYINTMTKVKIRCPAHGLFEQTPNEHLQSTYGCQSCYSIYNSFKVEDYDKICPDGSNLYIVNLFNDEDRFYKVGISKNIERRFKQYTKDGYSIGENIIFFNNDAGLISSLEDDILRNNGINKYTPKKKFKGWTECFSYIDIDDITEMFYTFNKLQREIKELTSD